MKHMPRLLTILMLAAFASGCTGEGPQRMYETAQFEEKQMNTPNALKIYRDIVEKYPESETAARARERIEALSE